MAIFGITKKYWVMIFPAVGFAVGCYVDRQETLRMTSFRDKSHLYGRVLKEGEQPSWP